MCCNFCKGQIIQDDPRERCLRQHSANAAGLIRPKQATVAVSGRTVNSIAAILDSGFGLAYHCRKSDAMSARCWRGIQPKTTYGLDVWFREWSLRQDMWMVPSLGPNYPGSARPA